VKASIESQHFLYEKQKICYTICPMADRARAAGGGHAEGKWGNVLRAASIKGGRIMWWAEDETGRIF
jgi:hypothetical protein